jgi:hypothetical protein
MGIRFRMRIALVSAMALLGLSGPAVSDEWGEGQGNSAALDSLDSRLSRHRLTRYLSEHIFILPDLPEQGGLDIRNSEESFLPYQGRIIRRIFTRRLDVWDREDGQTVDEPWFIDAGSALHFKTREAIIKSYLIVGEGEQLDPYQLADSERLLRSTDFIQDALIRVIPVAGAPDSVDLEIVTRDIWSLGISTKVRSEKKFDIRVNERNMLGLGHDFRNDLDFDTSRSPGTGYNGSYTARNLLGSFIDGRVEYMNRPDEEFSAIGFSRTLVAPRINYRGAISLRKHETLLDDGQMLIVETQDLWGSRGQPLDRNPAGGEGRTKLTLGARVINLDYPSRPFADRDLDQVYYDRLLTLGSVSLSWVNFRKGRLIYGFGRTEDVPYGFLASLTGGYESGEFVDRGYAALALRAAVFNERRGYFAWDTRFGAFIRDRELEDGVISLRAGYFSKLISLARLRYRQFANLSYTFGIHRRADDRLELADEIGLGDLENSPLYGKQRLVADLESVFFTPWKFIGFKLALFSFLSAGMIGPANDGFLSAKLYSSIGCGLRLKNERLIFDAIEFRFTYRPIAPGGIDAYSFEAHSADDPTWLGYRPGAPFPLAFE